MRLLCFNKVSPHPEERRLRRVSKDGLQYRFVIPGTRLKRPSVDRAGADFLGYGSGGATKLGCNAGGLAGRDFILPQQRHGEGGDGAAGSFDDRTAIGKETRVPVIVGKIAAFGRYPVQCSERLLAADAVMACDDFRQLLSPALDLKCRH